MAKNDDTLTKEEIDKIAAQHEERQKEEVRQGEERRLAENAAAEAVPQPADEGGQEVAYRGESAKYKRAPRNEGNHPTGRI